MMEAIWVSNVYRRQRRVAVHASWDFRIWCSGLERFWVSGESGGGGTCSDGALGVCLKVVLVRFSSPHQDFLFV